jgi:hypothetical protein
MGLNNVKNDQIGRGFIMGKDDLNAKAVNALRRLQKLPHIIRDSSAIRSCHTS